jgi:hypothetical protein
MGGEKLRGGTEIFPKPGLSSVEMERAVASFLPISHGPIAWRVIGTKDPVPDVCTGEGSAVGGEVWRRRSASAVQEMMDSMNR